MPLSDLMNFTGATKAPLVIALVPLKCFRLSFTKETMHRCHFPFQNEAYRSALFVEVSRKKAGKFMPINYYIVYNWWLRTNKSKLVGTRDCRYERVDYWGL